jgi:transposase
MNQCKRIGIDIAKQIFQVHGVDQKGNTVLTKKLLRHELLRFFAQHEPVLIGIESCGGAHYWARELKKLGHEVKLMSPQFVSPYRKSGKNDHNDAEAICEAVGRPTMRFVAVKTEEQQTILVMHRIREQWMGERTSLMNQIRGHLQEFGVVINQGRAALQKTLAEVLENDRLPLLLRDSLRTMGEALRALEARLAEVDKRIESWSKQHVIAKRLMTLGGVGTLTASAVVATTGDARLFKQGRQFSAWLGLVPKQNSSGGKTRLGSITKRGDRYLRTLLIQGARSVMLAATRARKNNVSSPRYDWIYQLQARRPDNVVAVAIAAKQARILWAMMAKGEDWNPHHHELSNGFCKKQ